MLDSFLDSSVAGSASGCLLLSQLGMLLWMKEMLEVVGFLSKRCHYNHTITFKNLSFRRFWDTSGIGVKNSGQLAAMHL